MDELFTGKQIILTGRREKMKNIYDMVTNPNAKSYEDRLDRIFDEINTINYLYSPPIFRIDSEYQFIVNKNAFRNDCYVQAIRYDKVGQNQPNMIDRNQQRLHQEKLEINRVTLFMTEYNKLERLERRMLCHEYFKRYFPQSVKEISLELGISTTTLSKIKKIAKEKMVVSCCLDIYTTWEYGNYLQSIDIVEDERIERWKKLGLEYQRKYEKWKWDWED